MKTKFWILIIAYLSFFSMGFDQGAFTIAWLEMETELGLQLSHTGFFIGVSMSAYALISGALGKLTQFMKLPLINFVGAVCLALGFLLMGLSENLATLLLAAAFCGAGLSMITASLNAYGATQLEAIHLNFMNGCFGIGAAISPWLMAQVTRHASWRTGYFILSAIVGFVAVLILMSIWQGIWEEAPAKAVETSEPKVQGNFLSGKKYQILEVFECFICGGMDYSLVFFTGIILAYRGLPMEQIAMYPIIYYIFLTVGSMGFGWLSKTFSDMAMIRSGLFLAAIGVLILLFTSHMSGMAIAGLGMAPIFPTIVHDTSNRFSPRIVDKLVGYEVSAFGVGVALLFFLMGQVLELVSMEFLFPIILSFIGATFLINEALHVALKRANK